VCQQEHVLLSPREQKTAGAAVFSCLPAVFFIFPVFPVFPLFPVFPVFPVFRSFSRFFQVSSVLSFLLLSRIL
jgi:hypothetical protein